MIRRARSAVIAYVLGALVLPAAAGGIERLDDSSSPRARVQAPLVTNSEGRPLADSFNSQHAVLHFGLIDYRLATARFMGQRARIYYVIPGAVRGLMSPTALQVTWRSRGEFASGSGRPGDHTLVWSGTITQPFMEQSFELDMELNLRMVVLSANTEFGLESYFEIETSP